MHRLLILIWLVASTLHSWAAEDPFAAGVRATEPLPAAGQQKTFKLPSGFEIQLVAAEPDLRKPMNMAFDSAGRLWITESREYPFPAKPGEPARDSVRIFSDFGPDGRARKMEIFADGLNIPIGLHPFPIYDKPGQPPRWGCILWSIPNIWRMEDTDGDGRADKREVLFGPLGWERDTHGNQASFRRGADGWIYATHGFNNTSTFKARDGSGITLNSGNTYRFRADGSRVEQFTWGQVNPFGMCVDPLGNFYTADCHSSPIYQLLRGGYYPSFGKPHDGLGFAPTVIQHSHGSTALCGIVYLSDPAWPAEYRDQMLVGNVMTSRINRDQITFTGSSPKGKELPDFLSSTDPWFRPVDLQWGPDGALYIADFYNRIIGHYEVPLTHPARDRERGRLWRVVHLKDQLAKPVPFNLTAAKPGDLVGELMSGNPTRQSLAMGELELRADKRTLDILKGAASGQWHFRQGDARPGLMTGALWVLHRRGALDAETLHKAADDRDRVVRVHALRILGESAAWKPASTDAVLKALADKDPFVQRAAAEALALHPAAGHVEPLLLALPAAPAADAHLVYVLRHALREQFRAPGAFDRYGNAPLRPADARVIADVAATVPSPGAAAFLLSRIAQAPAESVAAHVRHIARHAPQDKLAEVTALARARFATDLDQQAALLKAMQEGAAQRGAVLPPEASAWGAALAGRLLATGTGDAAWENKPLSGATDARSPWAFQERACADGQKAQLMSSFPLGETLTGSLRSAPFELPKQLAFYLCGHDGVPGQAAQKKNAVRLRHATTGETLAEAVPPRSDVAQKVTWNLAAHAGKSAYFEAVDGDTGSGFAWLAFGRFNPLPPQLVLTSPTQLAQRQVAGAELARDLRLAQMEKPLASLMSRREADAAARAAAMDALAALGLVSGQQRLLGDLLRNADEPAVLRERAAQQAARLPELRAARADALAGASARMQPPFARALSGDPAGAALLLAAVQSGKAPAVLLQDTAVKDRLPEGLKGRAAALTQGLPPADEAIQKLIAQRLDSWRARPGSVDRGRELFQLACAACHQKGGVGQLVGPQLDGLAARGAERVLEDILDPHRNVDVAFRYKNVKLKDGQLLSLLPRREAGQTLIFADGTGKEVTIAQADIVSQTPTTRSLMPDNFGTATSPQQLNDLLAFLMAR